MSEELRTPAHQNRVVKTPIDIPLPEMNRRIKTSFAKVAATQSGRDVLEWIMHFSGYKRSCLTMNEEGVILRDASLHNAALQTLWYAIRQNLLPEHVNKIEMEKLHADPPQQTTKKK